MLFRKDNSNILSFSKTIIVLIQIAYCFFNFSTAATLSQIQNCESNSSSIFGYGQCINCSLNCSLCNGTVDSSNVCQIPSASSCMLPGYLYNALNVCVDCRLQENCLKNCNGYWDPTLNTCIRKANTTYKIQGGKSCLSLATEAECQMCVDQKYGWSTSLQKCLKCPSGSAWDATTMKCSQLSNCDTNNLLYFDNQTGSCKVCSNSYLLNNYSGSCELCPSNCTCTTAYSSCDSNSCVAPYTQTDDVNGNFCECKGSTYIKGTTCQPCPDNCQKCDTSGYCIQCSNGFLIDKVTFQCVSCAVPSSNPLYCEIKVFAYCSQLTSDGKYCNTCIQNLIYDPIQKYCICPNGGVFSSTQNTCVSCQSLFPNCGKCNTSQCIECFDSTFQLASDSKICDCKGYVQIGTCVPCTNSLSNCAQCDITGKSCISCLPTFGLITTSNTCYACSTIDKNCISCNDKNICLACTNGFSLQTNSNTCVCNTSLNQFVVVSNTCLNCLNAIPNCSKCSLNSASNAAVCTSCNSPYVVSNGTCQLCAAGSYRNGNSCIACTDLNCSQCNSNGCYSCTNGYSLSQNQCVCNAAGYVIDSADKKCKTCASRFNSTLCLTCSSAQCIQCGGTGFTATSTGCSCQNGVIVPNTSTCTACAQNCSVCTLNSDQVNTTCTQCSTNYRLMADNSCKQCQSGQYYDQSTKQCLTCNPNCSACPDNQGGDSCTACSNNYVLDTTNGACSCPSQIIDSNNQCVNCYTQYGQQCQTCNPTQCLTCATNYYLQGSTKTCIQCASNQFFQQNTTNDCVNCPLNCTACAPLTGVCTGSCLNNYDLLNGICQCTGAKILNNSGQCIGCSVSLPNCSLCTSISQCSKCAAGYNLMANGTCGQCLATQYYLSTSLSCVNCAPNCSACTNETGICTGNCFNNYRLEKGACVCTLDRALDNSKNCQLCTVLFSNCSQCNTSGCTQCFAPFTVGSDGQCRVCSNQETYVSSSFSCQLCSSLIKNCSSCSSSTSCSKCSGNFVPSSDSSSCICPAGFYQISGNSQNNTADQCIQCSTFDSNCLQCSGLNACTLCTQNYAFDSSLQKCRTCSLNEYYNYEQEVPIQQCTNCSTIHPECAQCKSGTKCSQCSNNYDLFETVQSSTCQCSGNKILAASTNPGKKNCLLCSQIVDINCEFCSETNKCDKCLPNYVWDTTYNKCLPNITLSITSSSGKNLALADNFILAFTVPQKLLDFQFNITTYFFDSDDQYNTEVQLLNSSGLSPLDIPFNFQNCYIYFQDNLNNKTNNNYKQEGSDNQPTLVRKNNLLLHQGKVRFVYTVESLNNSFQRFAISYDLEIKSQYTNAKEVSIKMGPNIEEFDQFSLYNIFFELLLMQNQICTSDSQCLNNGVCLQAQKLCQCKGNFLLFDCSDYDTERYNLVIQYISQSLLVLKPVNYQQKIIAQYLPLLVTSDASLSVTGMNFNFYKIQSLADESSLNSTQQNKAQILMLDTMNTITQAISELDPNFTPQEIYSSIQKIYSLTDQLLPLFNNNISFVTDTMQAMGQVSYSSNQVSSSVSVSNLFNPASSNSNILFQKTDGTTGSTVKILLFAFQSNPHKLATPQFLTQPNNYPLIIMNTYQLKSRILEQNNQAVSTFTPFNQNITFIFKVTNPQKLQNPICLQLVGITQDQYIFCGSIQIQSDQVICTCQNSATLYEDIYFHYTEDPNLIRDLGNNVPTSYVVAIVILSVILGLLIYVQIRNRRRYLIELRQKQQEQLLQQQNKEAQKESKEIKETHHEKNFISKGSEITMNTQNYEGILQSSILKQKDVKLNLFENSPEQLYQQDCIIQDQFDLEQKSDEENASNHRSIERENIFSPNIKSDEKSTIASDKFRLAKQV